MPYIPHNKTDTEAMLACIGVDSIDQLFDEIPDHLLIDGLAKVPTQMSEPELTRLMKARAKQDEVALSFLGAGAYEHYIPAAVWEIASRGEFMTAYTPYQAEASQGSLQLIYEYQTMMAKLTGMAVSNASMYDGATALAEAILMAYRQKKEKIARVLIPEACHPAYRKVAENICRLQGIDLVTLPFDKTTGCIDKTVLDNFSDEPFFALVIPHPNFFGNFEAIDELTDFAHQHKALVIACCNPIALALFKEPGSWGTAGADLVCGEGQPLGVPLASGGPYFGFLCCKQVSIRQMPGRLVGRTVDTEGKVGYTLTLQAREQHIRRAKAKSNICTNQGLLVTAATIHMALLGSKGLRAIALQCYNLTQILKEKLRQLAGVDIVFDGQAGFHEYVIRLDKPVAPVLAALAAQGIQGGYAIAEDYPELANCLLICVTETKTLACLDRFVSCLEAALTPAIPEA